jgi:F-type H+-transporting ATPase subunit b
MNILSMCNPKMLTMVQGAGGLFDFNTTLPLMALQILLLSVALTFIFYKPVEKVIDEREAYINNNFATASEKLIKADELYRQYDDEIRTACDLAVAILQKAHLESKNYVEIELEKTRTKEEKRIKDNEKILEWQERLAVEELAGKGIYLFEVVQALESKLVGNLL